MAAKSVRPGVVPLHEGAGVGVEGPPSGAAGDGVRLRGMVLLAPTQTPSVCPKPKFIEPFQGAFPP